jgi:hypothetical protein
MAQQWYMSRGGRTFGPLGTDRLQAMAQAGELAPHDLLVTAGGTQWVAAASVPGLFPQAQPPAAPPVTAPPLSAPPQPPRAAPAVPVAPAMRVPVVAQAAPPPPPQIEVDPQSTFDRYQYESFRSVRDDLSLWIVIPAVMLMALHAGAMVVLPCWWLYGMFLVLQGVESYSRIAWGRVAFSLAFSVVVPVLIEFVQFRMAKGLRRGERSAAYGLLIFMLLYVAVGAALVLLPPEELPSQLMLDDELRRRIMAGVLFGVVGLLQLPALIGAIREWDKFE